MKVKGNAGNAIEGLPMGIDYKSRSAEEKKRGRAEVQLTSGLLDFWASALKKGGFNGV